MNEYCDLSDLEIELFTYAVEQFHDSSLPYIKPHYWSEVEDLLKELRKELWSRCFVDGLMIDD